MVAGGAFNLTWLRSVYETYPRRVSFLELLVFFGILVSYWWIVSFWFWGVYLLEIPLPAGLSAFFYKLWLVKNIPRGFLIALLLCSIILSFYIRRISLREMGIRTDNIWVSGRECLVVIFIILVAASALLLIYRHNFSIENYFVKQQETRRELLSDLFLGLISGIAQQFLLQCFFLQRTLKIFRNPATAIFFSSAIFSSLHIPNIRLMIVTFIFGTMCSVLFLRNRNIFTVGITHGISQQILRIFFASVFVSGSYYNGRGNYEYNLRVGPPKAYPEYLAELKYEGTLPVMAAASAGGILIPVSVTNKSTEMWSSTDGYHLVFASYHFVDQDGQIISEDGPLTPLSKPIGPGDSETVNLMVTAPSKSGNYLAEVDIVHTKSPESKKLTWFKRRGSKTILIPITAP